MWRKTINAFSRKSAYICDFVASISNTRGTIYYDSFITARESSWNIRKHNINHNLLLNRLISNNHPAYKAVVFDKDGTLICFDTMWIPWAKYVAHSLSKALNVELREQIFSILGVCAQDSKTHPGLLAEGTTAQILEAISNMLISQGVPAKKAQQLTSRYINEHTVTPDHISPLHNLKELFTILRQHNIRIAVCTSDSRLGTLKSLAELDVLHLIDVTVCGDDIDGLPKPHPRNAHRIFEMLNVQPEQTVMVGDTRTDMLFAKNGNFGMAVGVLSGVGKREDLEEAWFQVGDEKSDKKANPATTLQSTKFHIVRSVADILPLVLPDSSIPVRLHCTRARVHDDEDVNVDEQRLKEVEYKLIIFDKNGSLTNVHPRWSKWAEDICEKLKVRTSIEMAQKFSNILGYSPDTRQAAGGMLAESSMLHIRDCLGYLLTLNGYGLKRSAHIVNEIWYTPELSPDDMLPGAIETIRELKRNGLRIAVNTSDGHVACASFLACSKLHDQIDMVLSAEDADRYPKPLPHTVHRIMDAMSCKPEQTIVVGDTPADLISGHAAGVGLTIGVLSGFSLAHNLLPHADLLMPNVTYLQRVVQRDAD